MKQASGWFHFLSLLILSYGTLVVSVDAHVNKSPNHQATVPERTTCPSFGLLVDRVSGNARRVTVSGGELNNVGLTSKLKKRSVSHFKASVLTLGLFSIPIWRQKVGVEVVVALVVLYLLEVLTCSTRRYLSNALTPVELCRLIDDLVLVKPEIIWELECYHYRTQHIGKSSSEDKVVTYRARRSFGIESWRDVTDTPSIDRYLDAGGPSACFVKISISKLILFLDKRVEERYAHEESVFRSSWYDVHNDFRARIHIEGFRPKLLVMKAGISDISYARTLWFWVFSLIGLTVPYRVWFSKHCTEGEITLTKGILM